MNLATVDEAGRPVSRMVLLKGLDERGLRFFSHYDGPKGRQLAARPPAALCFYWPHLREGVQVRVEGAVTRLPTVESDAYFASRPRMSQLGAWASRQSQTLASPKEFQQRLAHFETLYAAAEVPRPEHWGGFLLAPELLEFWYGAAWRLHRRERWEWREGVWHERLLYP